MFHVDIVSYKRLSVFNIIVQKNVCNVVTKKIINSAVRI